MKSRKKARQVTSLFHKLTQQMDQAKARNDIEAIARIQIEIDEMGGREEYQRASQLSTKFHSTSKWVLKVLGRKGWTHGMELGDELGNELGDSKVMRDSKDGDKAEKKKPTEILEVGAINTELLDASKRTARVPVSINKTSTSTSTSTSTHQQYQDVPLYNINVRAIDLRSSHSDIEEMDFLSMPVTNSSKGTYDAIVCSMVLNCVTTPQDRGTMLSLLYKQLRPGGLCFFTIPRLCINQSKFINRQMFEELLTDALGFVIHEEKETPKVAFWVLKRPETATTTTTSSTIESQVEEKIVVEGQKQRQHQKKDGKMVGWNKKWEKTRIVNRGQKYRNVFGVTLKEGEVYGRCGGDDDDE